MPDGALYCICQRGQALEDMHRLGHTGAYTTDGYCFSCDARGWLTEEQLAESAKRAVEKIANAPRQVGRLLVYGLDPEAT